MTAAAEEAAALGQRSASPRRSASPSRSIRCERRRVERPLDARERQRLVEPEPEQQPLAALHVVVEGLDARAAAPRRAPSAAT